MTPTKKSAPTMLPIVTMIMLFIQKPTQFRLAYPRYLAAAAAWASENPPAVPMPFVKIPAEMRYWLSMECSNPVETKAMIGNQIPKNFPIRSSAQIPSRIARLTSQLHPTPFRNADQSAAAPTYCTLNEAIPIALMPNAVTVPAPAAFHALNGPYAMIYAYTIEPMRFPIYTHTQRLSTAAQLILWMNAAIGASIASPVKSSAPVSTVMISPTGNTAPRIRAL